MGIGVNMACVGVFANAFCDDFILAAESQKNIFHTGGGVILLFCILVFAVNFGCGGNWLMFENILTVENVCVAYGAREMVHDVTFSIKRGEILVIVGESGSGKSTILKAVGGLLGNSGAVTDGQIFFNGAEITVAPASIRRKLAGESIGYIFQNATASFCPIRKIGEQIFESVQAHKNWNFVEFLQRAKTIMQNINLDESALEKYPFQLSGGMGQRAGILAAMILEPQLLLADEPTSALDPETQKSVIEEFLKLRERYGVSIIMVTHNLQVAEYIADKILILREGNMIEYGTKNEIFNSPQEDYTKELLSASFIV